MEIIPYIERLKEPVGDFIQATWAELGHKWGPDDKDKDILNIPDIYQKPGGEFLTVVKNGDVIGTIALKPISKNECELKRFYLSSEYQSQGLGSRLLQMAIAKAKENGFQVMKLDTTSKSEKALHLFRKAGFVEIPAYNDDPYAEIFMALKL